MKIKLLAAITLLSSFYGHTQSLESTVLFNSSSEKRLDKAFGVSVMYLHDIGQNHALGLSVCYKVKHSEYDRISHGDYDHNTYIFEMITSNSKSASFRINYQYAIINRDQTAFSIGPEFSYNMLWGKDNSWFSHSRDSVFRTPGPTTNETIKKVGVGFLSRFQVKKIFVDNLSLAIQFRPEVLISDSYDGGYKPYSGILSNAEFGIGLNYRLTPTD